jgi:polysaccharide chain length determinant protein (PEP-CTERM system associated)
MQGQGPQLERMAEAWGRRKWLALAVFTFTAAAGVTLAFSLPPIYRATATVIVEQGRTSGGPSVELESRLQLISQELLSRARLEALIRSMDLYPVLRQRAPMEAAVSQMRRDILTESKVQPQPSGIGNTIAFAISYRGANPEVVVKVANSLASSYLEEDRQIRERQTSGTVRMLKAQLDDVKQELEQQERGLAEFQDQHLGELPQQADANLANLARLQAELRTATEERLRAIDRRNELLRQVAEADVAPASAGIGPRLAPSSLTRRREELAELSRRYSDKYPDVIRLKAEVAELEKEAQTQTEPAAEPAGGVRGLAQRLRDAQKEIEVDISGLKSDEARLRAEIADHIQRLENAPRRQRGYQQVARDYQTTRDLYDSVRKRYEQAQLEEGEGGAPGSSPFRILDPAIVPNAPVAPNRLVLLLVTLIGSLLMAAAAVWLADMLDTSLHSADDVRAFTRVPVVASIPLIVTEGDRRSRQRRAWLATAGLLLALGAVTHGVHRVARTNEGIVLMLARGRP